MSDKYSIPEMPDGEYEALPPDQKKIYNEAIRAKNIYNKAKEDYEISMSLLGPGILIILGIPLLLLYLFGLVFIVIGIIWAFFRVAARSQAYQRYRDAEKDLQAALEKSPKSSGESVKGPAPPPEGLDGEDKKNLAVIVIVLAALIIVVYLMLQLR